MLTTQELKQLHECTQVYYKVNKALLESDAQFCKPTEKAVLEVYKARYEAYEAQEERNALLDAQGIVERILLWIYPNFNPNFNAALQAAEEKLLVAEETLQAAEETLQAAKEKLLVAEETLQAAKEKLLAAEETTQAAEEKLLVAEETTQAAKEKLDMLPNSNEKVNKGTYTDFVSSQGVQFNGPGGSLRDN
jgi:hypothetical protein